MNSMSNVILEGRSGVSFLSKVGSDYRYNIVMLIETTRINDEKCKDQPIIIIRDNYDYGICKNILSNDNFGESFSTHTVSRFFDDRCNV